MKTFKVTIEMTVKAESDLRVLEEIREAFPNRNMKIKIDRDVEAEDE